MDKKNMLEFLKSDSKQSSTRLMLVRLTNTAIFVAIITALGGVFGFISGIILNRDLALLGSALGGLAGLSAGLVGTLLVPSFGAKVGQSFSENNKSIDKKEEN